MKVKHLFLILFLLQVISPVLAQTISRIEPAFWWTGMKNDELQLMVFGNNISKAEVSINYPGVEIKQVKPLESPNYLVVYLKIKEDAKPGTFNIVFKQGRWKKNMSYQLKAREKDPKERLGFNQSDVLYLIMPDRFADGDPKTNVIPSMRFPSPVNRNDPNARHGGDLQGIVNHLDYIQSLGVTAIWLNPVLENDMPGGSYHGYATTDYYKVDPRFGTNEYYKFLIDECHKRGMKVVMDMIFNHCGSEHIWFRDRPTKDWFNFPNKYVQTSYRLTPWFDPYVTQYDKDITVKGWFVESMPDLNQKNEDLMRYLTQNSIWWIEYAGIDGIRMDTHPYVYFEEMAEWNQDVMKEYPKFSIVGECWYGTEAGSAWWQENAKINKWNSHLKYVMDFPLNSVVRQSFEEQTDKTTGLNLVYDKLAMDFLYTNPQDVLIFLDNHDTDRFLLEEPKNLGFWKQAITFLLTTRGIPQIYYGTEILMHGSKKETDGLVRKDFPGGFPNDKVNDFLAQDRTPMQNEAFDFMQKMLQIRKGNPVIAYGKLMHYMPINGIYVYRKHYQGKNVLVIMNGNDQEKVIDMSRYNEVTETMPQLLTDLISGKQVQLQPTMRFAPRAIHMFEY